RTPGSAPRLVNPGRRRSRRDDAGGRSRPGPRPGGGDMAERWFLDLDGIDGGSTDTHHVGDIDVLVWSWGLAQRAPTPGSGSGAGAGRAAFEDLHVTAPTSVATPKLFLTCATGRHIPTAVLAGEGGGKAGGFLRIKLAAGPPT